jgi:hypothetical protein
MPSMSCSKKQDSRSWYCIRRPTAWEISTYGQFQSKLECFTCEGLHLWKRFRSQIGSCGTFAGRGILYTNKGKTLYFFKVLTGIESLHSRMHFHHLLPSVSTFLTCWYRTSCMNLNSAYGRLFSRTLSVFWSHTVTVQFKTSIDDIGRFPPLEGPLFAASLKMRQEWRSWLREILRISSRCVCGVTWNLNYF